VPRPAGNFWKDAGLEDPVVNNHPPLHPGLNTREAAILDYAEELAASKASGTDVRFPAGADIVNADIAAAAAIAESKLNLASDAAAATASRRTLGNGVTQAAAGNHVHSGIYEPAGLVATHEADTTGVHGLSSTAACKGVAIHNGSTYPARPTGFASIEWIGPTDPGASAQNNDTWIPT